MLGAVDVPEVQGDYVIYVPQRPVVVGHPVLKLGHEIRERISRMFPTQKKIELFARHQVEGWQSWGNEHLEMSICMTQ